MMIRILQFSIAALFATTAYTQTTDLVFFTDDGAKFTLIIDGDTKNAAPATRVVATGIRTETPVVMIKFEDPALGSMKKSGYFDLGKEYTLMVTTNKKGERVLRPTGEAALGTAKSNVDSSAPIDFVDDPVDQPIMNTGIDQRGVGGISTTTVIEHTEEGGTERVGIDMGMNGVGIDLNVAVTEGGSSSTSTHTTTTTTTTHTTNNGAVHAHPVVPVTPVREPPTYHMPGYTGPVGCAWPMSATEFADAKLSIEGQSFEESKMTTAKQVGLDRCFTTDQVKGIMGTFSFEDTKLEFAKYAYERTFDIGNYYKLNNAFTFESSIQDLNAYIQGR